MRQYQLFKSDTGYQPQLVEVAKPVVEAGQVLIRVRAASINFRDYTIASTGVLKEKTQGLVPFSDGAGEVEAIGAGVTHWKVGDRVTPNFFPHWVNGRFDMRYHQAALGGTHPGMLSEYALLPESALVPVPTHLSLEEASTLPCAALTAWHGLFERGRLQPGETVLTGGTGGVSIFALQLAKAAGARVIITSSSDEKLARARALGADETINYKTTPDWDQAALHLTGGRGVDHVVETGGAETYQKSIRAVAAGGNIHQLGILSGAVLQPNLFGLQLKNATIHGLYVGSVEMFKRMNSFLTNHRIQPVVDRVFDFEHALEAYQLMSLGGHFGKIVIRI